MAYIRLQFPSLMQAWGVAGDDWLSKRRTASAPTRRGIIGMIGCAMGIHMDEKEKLIELDHKITSVKNVPSGYRVTRMTDEQTISVAWMDKFSDADLKNLGVKRGFRTAAGGVKTVSGLTKSQQIWKDYLSDTAEQYPAVEIHGSEEFLSDVIRALAFPVYPYYFGRKCCIPCGSVLADGVIYQEKEDA